MDGAGQGGAGFKNVQMTAVITKRVDGIACGMHKCLVVAVLRVGYQCFSLWCCWKRAYFLELQPEKNSSKEREQLPVYSWKVLVSSPSTSRRAKMRVRK